METADKVMKQLLTAVFLPESSSSALKAIGLLCVSLGSRCSRYGETIVPIFLDALDKYMETEQLIASLEALSLFIRAAGILAAPFSDGILASIVSGLSSPLVARNEKTILLGAL